MSNFNSRSFTIEGGHDADIGLDILIDDPKELSLRDAIIDLYLNVKIRNSEDVSTSDTKYINRIQQLKCQIIVIMMAEI